MSHSHHEHDGPAPVDPPRIVEVAEGIFAYVQPDGSWWINNTGFVVGSSMVLSIDTCSTERRTKAYLDAVSARAGSAPRLLVNTHQHGDHTNGNCFLPYATIIGHEQCRSQMLATGIFKPDGVWDPVEWGELTLAPPFVTFQETMNVYVDDLLVELHHVGPAAHTTSDVVAWIPSLRVLFSGDLVFNGGTPFALMGSVSGSLAALDGIAALDPEVIVPGHGDPCGTEALADVRQYLELVQRTGAAAHGAGIAPLDVARQTDLGAFAHLTDSERFAGNLHRAYAEIEGAAPGAPIDLLAAFGDMVALNGGRPLRCYA